MLRKFQTSSIDQIVDWQANQRLPFVGVEALRRYPVKFPEAGSGNLRVFALSDPRDQTVRWIGFTSQKRPKLPKSANPAMAAWVTELQLNELRPEVTILDQVCPMWSHRAKESWLAYARNLGRLYNYSDQLGKPR